MTSSVRRCSEQSDISLVESFIEEADDFNETGDEFVLVDDQETPDSETCTWEECIASIKVIYKLFIDTITSFYFRIVIR